MNLCLEQHSIGYETQSYSMKNTAIDIRSIPFALIGFSSAPDQSLKPAAKMGISANINSYS